MAKVLMAAQWLDLPLPGSFIEPANTKGDELSIGCFDYDIQITPVGGMTERAGAPVAVHVLALKYRSMKLHVLFHFCFSRQRTDHISGRRLVSPYNGICGTTHRHHGPWIFADLRLTRKSGSFEVPNAMGLILKHHNVPCRVPGRSVQYRLSASVCPRQDFFMQP